MDETVKRISGHCLCGEVSFELDNDFDSMNLCHCKQCQRATGSAHASNLFTRTDNITWLSGKDLIRRFDVPGRAISNAFCANCGSGLPYTSKTGKSLVVQAGLLNSPVTKGIPMRNIFIDERADWYDEAIGSPRFAAFGD